MAITKSTAVDQITVTENGIVLYREATRVVEDGNEIAKTFHDLEGKTYVFREFENLGTALAEWGICFAVVANDHLLASCGTHIVLKVYGDSTTALYLGLGQTGIAAFVFNVSVDVEDPREFSEEL
jgi:hypothetical protein